MSGQTIESVDLSIDKLFDDSYEVPIYQREFVWTDSNVDQLLSDLHVAFSSDDDQIQPEYFLGSIVVRERRNGVAVYELIDGQQRLTTLYLMLCAIRDHLADVAPHDTIPALDAQLREATVDDKGADVFRYRVALQYEDSRGVLEHIAGGGPIDEVEPATRSVKNIVNAYDLIRDFLRCQFGEDPKDLRLFYSYLVRHVKLIRIRTSTVAHALKVFETINDRGVGLDAMDLLKNLMFMHATDSQYSQLNDDWKQLVDSLYAEKEKPLRFLRYYVLSRHSVERLREDGIYSWFVRNADACGYTDAPVAFVTELLGATDAYTKFRKGLDVDGQRNRYLTNITYLSGSVRQHLILLLAGRHLSAECRGELARQLENLLFAFIIAREPTRAFERQFVRWAGKLRSVGDRQGLDAFVAENIHPAMVELSPRFALAFSDLDEWSVQKYRMKYILAKITQYVDEQAWGSVSPYDDLGTYINKQTQLEHILPRTANDVLLATFEDPDEYYEVRNRFGNLTLLESSINAAAGNGLFREKQLAYRQSHFLLTKSLGEDVRVGKNTAIDQMVRELEKFDRWDSRAIETRQAMLGRLAFKTWGMPTAAAAVEQDDGDDDHQSIASP